MKNLFLYIFIIIFIIKTQFFILLFLSILNVHISSELNILYYLHFNIGKNKYLFKILLYISYNSVIIHSFQDDYTYDR